MSQTYSKKRKMDTQGVPLWYKLALLLSIFTALPFLFMAYYLPEKDLWFEIFTFVLLSVSLFIVCAISLINFCKKTDEIQTYEEMIAERLGVYFEKLNNSVYRKRNMEWYLVPGHYWLELRIKSRRNNFVGQNNPSQIPTHPQETEENKGSKPNFKREELKTEEPMAKDMSDVGNLDQIKDE